MEIANQVRGFRFLLGVLRHQQDDPFCGRCSAFANTLQAARDRFSRLQSQEAVAPGSLPADLDDLLRDAREGLAAVSAHEQPSGQKKAGNCRLPQGVCFIKASFALFREE